MLPVSVEILGTEDYVIVLIIKALVMQINFYMRIF